MDLSPPSPSVSISHSMLNCLAYRRRTIRAMLTNSLRPPEPPEPPDPPDILLPSPPPLSTPTSWSFSAATPQLALGLLTGKLPCAEQSPPATPHRSTTSPPSINA
ncbi:unnamed protein product [Arabis nemorensis]|uniref:Uncharacterized protein n=1 Tax=Arabis nemorensis TaxID=586526 RepID=A0A565C5U0_9BRAS|nr:unnamed protein product [Arabis nemorensis]